MTVKFSFSITLWRQLTLERTGLSALGVGVTLPTLVDLALSAIQSIAVQCRQWALSFPGYAKQRNGYYHLGYKKYNDEDSKVIL